MADAKIAQKGPYIVDVEAGKTYYWCQCGRSNKQPFCDGSHSETEFTPMEYKAEDTRAVLFCGCKRSGRKPVCDGSHSRI